MRRGNFMDYYPRNIFYATSLGTLWRQDQIVALPVELGKALAAVRKI